MDDGAEDGDPLIEQMMRGRLGGWFPSVPRGELAALLQFCKCVMIPSTYVGDCRYATDGVARGIPALLSSSACAHADLWRELRWRLDDHGGGINVVKTKAHRSKQCAIDDSDDGILHWVGNGAADAAAKTLARSAWGAGAPQRDLQHELRVTHCRLLVKTAASAHLGNARPRRRGGGRQTRPRASKEKTRRRVRRTLLGASAQRQREMVLEMSINHDNAIIVEDPCSKAVQGRGVRHGPHLSRAEVVGAGAILWNMRMVYFTGASIPKKAVQGTPCISCGAKCLAAPAARNAAHDSKIPRRTHRGL
jgi:hypothetical protein